MRITTWNVLHRIHAVNWSEAPVVAYPDERDRVEGIAKRVASWLAADVDVVCLQEVSGDQLAALRAHVTPSVAVLEHRLARVPRPRAEDVDALADPAEHLVVLARTGARAREGHTFASDPGKGMLVVEVNDGPVVICTHVSYGDRGPAQLARLVASCHDDDRTIVVAGDFNAPADVVQQALGGGFALAKIDGSTRVVTGGASKTIDHVLVRPDRITSAAVLETGDLSDHLPVTAELAIAIGDHDR